MEGNFRILGEEDENVVSFGTFIIEPFCSFFFLKFSYMYVKYSMYHPPLVTSILFFISPVVI